MSPIIEVGGRQNSIPGHQKAIRLLDDAGVEQWSINSSGVTFVGDGGVVTQITDASTGVTLNFSSGQITTVTQNIAAAAEVSFVVTNSRVSAVDCVVVNVASGSVGGTTIASVTAVANGSFTITLTNLHASVAETGVLVINFMVIKGSAS